MRTRMRHLLGLATLVLAVGVAAPAHAQATYAYIFKPPVFVLQPGAVTTDFLNAPAGANSRTEFNARVVTAIPTTIQRTTLVAIVQFTPFNKTGGYTSNAPGFVFGPVFSVFNESMFALDFDVLDAYSGAAKASDNSDYTHKLVLEGDLFFKLGSMMTTDKKSHFSNLALYAFLANVATGLPSAASKWVLLTGVSLPIAP